MCALEWDRSRALTLAFDQGLFAAAVVGQQGRMAACGRCARWFLEPGKTLRKIGPTAFGQMCRAMLNEHFPDLAPEQLRIVGDPAWRGRDNDSSEHDWVLAFQSALGHRARKAKSNKQGLRHEAVWKAMVQHDGYAVDPALQAPDPWASGWIPVSRCGSERRRDARTS
jgi:hypothetical protein